MEFDPINHIVKLCLQGMALEDKGNPEAAGSLFLQAWNEATDDFERFLAAHYIARHQENPGEKLHWLETALQMALSVNDVATKSALPALHTNLAKYYEDIGDPDNASRKYALANVWKDQLDDKGPFYHGTKADLKPGDLLMPGNTSNYQPGLIMNHIYFTALVNGAGLAAALAKGDGHERVYLVEPTGIFEHDPNVTDKKFPGNLTRSYRTNAPLKIVGEVSDWARQSSHNIQQWREKLDNNKGEIIN